MTWQRLSERTQGLGADGPFEGVPDHLQAALVGWFKSTVENGRFWRGQLLTTTGVKLRLPVDPDWTPGRLVDEYVNAALNSEEFSLTCSTAF